MIGQETCPLPDDPALAATAAALNEAGYWAEIVDPNWRCLYMTDDIRLSYGGLVELAPYPVGDHIYGPERTNTAMDWRSGLFTMEVIRNGFTGLGPWILADTPGGREELRGLVDPRLRDIVDELSPADPPPACSLVARGLYTATGEGVDIPVTLLRLRDSAGGLAGTVVLPRGWRCSGHWPAVAMCAISNACSM